MRKTLTAVVIGLLSGLILSSVILLGHLYFSNIQTFIQTQFVYLLLALGLLLFIISVISVKQHRDDRSKILELEANKNKTEIELYAYQNRFETIFEHANVGVALLSLEGRILRVNKSLCEMLGYNESDMLAMNFFYLIHPNDLNNLQIHIQELLDKKIELYQNEQQCYRKNGEALWIRSALSLIRDTEDKPVNFILQIQNITLQKKAEERLRHMAYHDPLTSLANRNKLEQFINHILASSRRHQQGFALMFLDLDRFKNINDTLGHEAGDVLLQIIAERLRSAVRSTDMVARLAGDEFVLLITDVKKTESVALIAQKILENVMKVVVVKGQEIYITTSIGISLYPYDGQNMQTLMKNADLALYRSKEHGRNNYQFYTLEMTSRAQEKLALQNALGHALVKNEFYLNYQPKWILQYSWAC